MLLKRALYSERVLQAKSIYTHLVGHFRAFYLIHTGTLGIERLKEKKKGSQLTALGKLFACIFLSEQIFTPIIAVSQETPPKSVISIIERSHVKGF